jgi:hypothetical protein
MDGRSVQDKLMTVELRTMSPAPAVSCTSCGFAWNSPAMADGLRLLGSCPKCAGELRFADETPRVERFDRPLAAVAARAAEPHLVLGIPRRDSF